MKNLSGPLLKTGRTLPKHLLLAAAISALAACGGNPAPSSSSANNSSETTQVSSSAMPVSSSSIMESSSSAISSSSIMPSSSSAASVSSAPTSSGAGTLLDSDGTFANGQGLFAGNASGGYDASIYSWDGEVIVEIQSNATKADTTWEAQMTHDISVTEGQEYTYCFRAKSTVNRDIPINIDQGGTPGYASLMGGGEQARLTNNYQDFKYTFTASASDTSARITMTFGTFSEAEWGTVYVDDVGVYEGSECGDPSDIPAPAQGSGGKGIIDYISLNNAVPPITTNGNKVLFDGQPGSLSGVSLFWSNAGEGEKFYTSDVVSQLKNNWNTPLIRAAMAVETNFSTAGYLGAPMYNNQRVTTIVDAAIANNMYAIIDWHTHHAEAPQSRVEASKMFFSEMASKYGNNNNVIFEIYNEPTCATEIHDSPDPAISETCYNERTSWETIKEYAKEIIPEIRKHSDNLIIVGTPYYSQFVDSASENPIVAADFPGNADYADNIAYTLHFYAADPYHQEGLRSKAITALKNGIPLFVTEWGTVNANGDGNFDEEKTDIWLQFLYDNDISHANWSLTDKNEGASILTSGNGSGWSENNLTESGRYIKQTTIDWAKNIRPGD